MPDTPKRLPLALAVLTAAAGFGTAWWMFHPPETPVTNSSGDLASATSAPASRLPSVDGADLLQASANNAARAEIAARLRERLNQKGVRSDEAVLSFKDEAAYRRFLERALASGLTLVGQIDSLHSVRVRVGDYEGLVDELVANGRDYTSIGANPIFSITPPEIETRAERPSVPVGDKLLAALGLSAGTDTTTWGNGVLVAVLDGGASPDATFGMRLRYKDIGYGIHGLGADGAHGTSVASLVGGASPDARGVAPASEILSIRVTGPDGLSDAFTVAQGIFAAIEAEAKVINISLGGYATSSVLDYAIEEALGAGVAVVASAGNDQANRLAWPAAYEGVVSVGATDALGVQAIFSNSGDGLQLTAPGYAIQAAGFAGSRTRFSGTSASAPVVSGAIAALLSQHPTLTPLEAADILIGHTNDGGVAGPDPDYGNGTINLRWAMAYNDPDLVDPAIASQRYDAETGTIHVVVQNRGNTPVDELELRVTLDSTVFTNKLPMLPPRASTTYVAPVDETLLREGGKLTVISTLVLPAETFDRFGDNNSMAGSVFISPRR